MQMYKKPAQSLLEYVILTALIICIAVMFSGKFFTGLVGPNGGLGKHFNNMRQRMGVQTIPE